MEPLWTACVRNRIILQIYLQKRNLRVLMREEIERKVKRFLHMITMSDQSWDLVAPMSSQFLENCY